MSDLHLLFGDLTLNVSCDRLLGDNCDYKYSVFYQKDLASELSALCDKYGSDKGEILSSGHPNQLVSPMAASSPSNGGKRRNDYVVPTTSCFAMMHRHWPIRRCSVRSVLSSAYFSGCAARSRSSNEEAAISGSFCSHSRMVVHSPSNGSSRVR